MRYTWTLNFSAEASQKSLDLMAGDGWRLKDFRVERSLTGVATPDFEDTWAYLAIWEKEALFPIS